jgi:LysR family hydrogen peroxide-inducible transcriptional activator
MAVEIETRSASVALARFPDPAPSRTIGMIWRRSTPLAGQLRDLAEIVRRAAVAPTGRAG